MVTQNKNTLYRAGSPIDKQIGLNLRYLRQEADLSQSFIADKLGVSFQQYQKYENGNNRLSCSRLLKLKYFFNVPYENFFKNIDTKNMDKEKHQPNLTTSNDTDTLTLRITNKVNRLRSKDLKVKINRMIDIITS